MNNTTKVVLLAGVAAAVGAIVQTYLTNRLGGDSLQSNLRSASPQPGANNSGSQWNNASLYDELQPTPQLTTFAGPGRQHSSTNFNGVIWAQRFNKGGNPNAGGNGSDENSWAFQTATKNPYANGTSCAYAKAVVTATQDPTNQVTSLVLGPGVAPNNPAA